LFHLMRYVAAKALPKGHSSCELYFAATMSVAAQLEASGYPREKIQVDVPLLPQESLPDEPSMALGRWLDKAPTVLYIGHFLPNKGVELLLDAFAKLHHSGVRLLLAWSGLGDLHGIQKQAKLLGIKDRMMITDYPVHKSTVFTHASALALPARASYGQTAPPMIMLEAFRAGIPVVIPRLRSVSDVGQEDKTVVFMDRGDSSTLVCQLQRILDQPEFAERMRIAQREWFKEHQSLDPSKVYDAVMKRFHG